MTAVQVIDPRLYETYKFVPMCHHYGFVDHIKSNFNLLRPKFKSASRLPLK